ncbi:MAG: hypothetical protein AB8H86_11400 [Polyangiales bacterium]
MSATIVGGARAFIRVLLKERATRVGLSLALIGSLACVAFPLFGVHGIEAAFAIGAAFPFFVTPCAAALARSRRKQPLAAFRAALVLALATWLIPVLLLALNALRVRQCEPGMGFLFMVAGPLPSIVLGAVLGAAIGVFVRKRALLFAGLAPLVALFFGLHEFWSSPAIFVFSHLLGWFPGTLYDVGRSFPLELLTFRALTLLWIFTLLAFVWLRLSRGRLKQAALIVSVTLLALSVWGHRAGATLGHRATVDDIAEHLGVTRRSRRCVVHHPRELEREASRRLLADCDFRVARAERLLGVTQPSPVHAFFYRDAAEKMRFMGAGRTFIAKPWRSEVHLQMAGWPHPVLGHEVVHAVAAQAARGPFRVSGTFGGYFPNAMLIEGIAVALDWPESDGLDPHGWSKAMREMEILPRASELQDVGFLGFDSRRSYAAAGSLTRFFAARHGTDALREAHRAGRFDVVEDLSELEAAWHEFLDEIVLPPGAMGLAELRFQRGSIFERVCPHKMARLRGQLGADLSAGDDSAAERTCAELLAIEPAALDARAALVGVASRLGRHEQADVFLQGLSGAPPQVRARAYESIADAAWARGQRRRARRIYRRLLSEPQSAGERRLREVKLLGLMAGGGVEARVRRIFVDEAPRVPTTAEIVDLARDVADLRTDGLGYYLVGRQLLAAGDYGRAAQRFELATLRGLPTLALSRELTRGLALAHAGNENFERAAELWRRALSDPALEHEAQEWLERISFIRSR